jgi:hypothetical protein
MTKQTEELKDCKAVGLERAYKDEPELQAHARKFAEQFLAELGFGAPDTLEFIRCQDQSQPECKRRHNFPLGSYTPKATAQICPDLLSDEQYARAREVQARYDKLLAESIYHSPASSSFRYSEIYHAVVHGDGAVPRELTSSDAEHQRLGERLGSREEFKADNLVIHQSKMTQLKRVSLEAIRLAAPVFAAAQKVVAEYLIQLEAGDRATADAFGVAYEPSPLWKASAKLLHDLCAPGRLSNAGLGSSPKSLLSGFADL